MIEVVKHPEVNNSPILISDCWPANDTEWPGPAQLTVPRKSIEKGTHFKATSLIVLTALAGQKSPITMVKAVRTIKDLAFYMCYM